MIKFKYLELELRIKNERFQANPASISSLTGSPKIRDFSFLILVYPEYSLNYNF